MKVALSLIFSIVLSSTCFLHGQQSDSDPDPIRSKNVRNSTYERVAAEIDYSKTKKALRSRRSGKDTEVEEEIIITGTVHPDSIKQGQEIEKKNTGFTLRATKLPGLPIFQILAYILIALLVGFLIYFIFSRIDIDRKIDPIETYEVEDDFEDINDLDTPSLLQQALAKGDYRTAVRIQFLSILQILSQKEKILWRKEKTNHEYARELRGESYGDNFQQMATIFDYVWYGKRDVGRDQYDLIDQEFSSFKTKLNES